MKRYVIFLLPLFVLSLFFSACAGRDAPQEPEVKVRGQYEFGAGVRS